MTQYRDGTVDLVNGSPVVQLVDGTVSGNILPGQWFVARGVPSENIPFTIAAIDIPRNRFSLNVPWPNVSDAGRPYTIHRDFSPSGFPEIDQSDVELPSIWNEWVRVLEGVLSGSISVTTSGTAWFTGSGAPSNAIGNDGDFYLNTSSADLYQKQSGSWGTPIMNLKGPQGDPGGSGTGTPGPAGVGVPVGGTAGQILQKLSGTNYDTGWRVKIDDIVAQSYLGRIAASVGPPVPIVVDSLTPKVPAVGDFLIGFAGTGEPRRFDVGNLPSTGSTGGTGQFADIAGDPYDNTALGAALDAKADVGSGEAVASGVLNPGAISITHRQQVYNQFAQTGAVAFALNVAGSSFNFGEAIFYFSSNGAALTWNANLVDARSGAAGTLPASLPAGSVGLFVITFDKANNRGLVFWPSAP